MNLRDLADMFDGKAEGPGWPDGVGWKPWWPMASEVWARKGKPHASDGGDPRHWAAAWALLQQLEAEYRQAKDEA